MRTKLAKETYEQLKASHVEGDQEGTTVLMDTSKYSKEQVFTAIDELNKKFGHVGYRYSRQEKKMMYAVYNGLELEQ